MAGVMEQHLSINFYVLPGKINLQDAKNLIWQQNILPYENILSDVLPLKMAEFPWDVMHTLIVHQHCTLYSHLLL
jgi:hypothetical protein